MQKQGVAQLLGSSLAGATPAPVDKYKDKDI